MIDANCRSRLSELFSLCRGTARGIGAEAAFDLYEGELTLETGRVKVVVRFSESGQTPDGRHHARASVSRTFRGAQIDSPSCWTDLDNTSDDSWWIGAVGDKSRPVDDASVRSWLEYSGPPPSE